MHLEGRSHKKKELMTASAGSAPSDGRGGGHLGSSLGAAYVCQLCDVPCSSYDAYTAHVRGAKHQKVCRLCVYYTVTFVLGIFGRILNATNIHL